MQDRLLSKPERAEFEELIAELRGQYSYSWSELSTAAGYTAPGGARKAHDAHYTNVHITNLQALRRSMHDVRKGIRKQHEPVANQGKVFDGTPLKSGGLTGQILRHSLTDKKVEPQKPILATVGAAQPAPKKTPPPAWYLAERRSDLTKEQKEEFAALVQEALGMGFSWNEIALRCGYKTAYGLQRTLEAGVQASMSNLSPLRTTLQQMRTKQIEPAGRRRTRVPPIPLSAAEKRRAEAIVQWLRRTGYGQLHLAHARGQRSMGKGVEDFYKAHHQALIEHIADRGESVDEIMAWYYQQGPEPRRNKNYQPPLSPVTIRGATETELDSPPGTPAIVTVTNEQVEQAVDRPPRSTAPVRGVGYVIEEMSKAKDRLVRVSETLGNTVAGVNELAKADGCPPFLKGAIRDASQALSEVNDRLISAITNHFEG